MLWMSDFILKATGFYWRVLSNEMIWSFGHIERNLWLQWREGTGGEAKVKLRDKLEGGCEIPGEKWWWLGSGDTVAGKGRSVNSRDIQGIRCGKRQEWLKFRAGAIRGRTMPITEMEKAGGATSSECTSSGVRPPEFRCQPWHLPCTTNFWNLLFLNSLPCCPPRSLSTPLISLWRCPYALMPISFNSSWPISANTSSVIWKVKQNSLLNL